MHRSRLGGLIIDCRTDDLQDAATFWSKALGYERETSAAPEDEGYALLKTEPDGLYVEVQQVEHESRVHLDIESDDVDAEVARLEGLGARRVRQVRTWWVMEAPTGQRFCVVKARTLLPDKRANQWK